MVTGAWRAVSPGPLLDRGAIMWQRQDVACVNHRTLALASCSMRPRSPGSSSVQWRVCLANWSVAGGHNGGCLVPVWLSEAHDTARGSSVSCHVSSLSATDSHTHTRTLPWHQHCLQQQRARCHGIIAGFYALTAQKKKYPSL